MISYNKRLIPSQTQRKIVVKGKNGWASYPTKLRKPVQQEKLYEEYYR